MSDASIALRVPFAPEQVGKLPRVTCKDCSKGNCSKHSKQRCEVCAAWISTQHIHLDFVGHAHVTDRLLSVDPAWTWEPVAFDEGGTPRVIVRDGEAVLWIRLTVDGVTRYGVGVCGANKDEREKQLISDAIRNASMRFGVALDLWAKGDLHTAAEAEDDRAHVARVKRLVEAVKGAGLQDWAKAELSWPWDSAACDAIEAKLGEPM